MNPMLFALAGVLLCSTAACTKSEIKKKALFLCESGQVARPSHSATLDAAKSAEYFRAADLDYWREEDKKIPEILGRDAFRIAVASSGTCEVLGVNVQEDKASVQLRLIHPDLSSAKRDYKALSVIDGEEARIAKAKEWLTPINKQTREEMTLDFVKTTDGWKADYEAPETAQRMDQIDHLLKEADRLSHGCDLAGAVNKLDQAEHLDSSPSETLNASRALLEKSRHECVPGGKWRVGTDDKGRTTVSLQADNILLINYENIIAQCVNGKPQLVITMDEAPDAAVIGDSIMYYLDDDKGNVVLTPIYSPIGVSFPDAEKWIDRLREKNHGTLTFMLVGGFQPEAELTFSIAGAATALARLKATCR